MSHPLDGCRAKIKRAKENIKNLEGEIAVLLQTENYRVVKQFNDQAREYVFAAIGPPVPLRISVLCGEIVHHLRSSLDHLIHALIVQNGGRPANNNEFPVSLTSQKFISSCKSGVIKGVSPTAQKLIESVQPYRTGDPTNAPLRILHDLDVTDKHRLLVVLCSTAAVPGSLRFPGKIADARFIKGSPWPWAGHTVRATKAGAEILRVTYTRELPQMDVEAQFSAQIAFEQFGTRKIEPIIPSLVELRNAVVKTIKLFDAEF